MPVLFSFATKALWLERGASDELVRLPELVSPTTYKFPCESVTAALMESYDDPPKYVLKSSNGSMKRGPIWL